MPWGGETQLLKKKTWKKGEIEEEEEAKPFTSCLLASSFASSSRLLLRLGRVQAPKRRRKNDARQKHFFWPWTDFFAPSSISSSFFVGLEAWTAAAARAVARCCCQHVRTYMHVPTYTTYMHVYVHVPTIIAWVGLVSSSFFLHQCYLLLLRTVIKSKRGFVKERYWTKNFKG